MLFCLSHYDYDGISTVITWYNYLNNKKNFKYDLCGYGTLDKKIDKLISNGDSIELLFIGDLNLDGNQFSKLINAVNIKKILYIDHHNIKDTDIFDIIKDNPKLKYVISKDKCAAALSLEYFKTIRLDKDFSHIDELIYYADIYDRWQIQSEDFQKAYMINELFWAYGYEKFLERFKDGFKINSEDVTIMKIVKAENEKYINDAFDNYSLVLDKLLIITHPDAKHINDFTIFKPDYDYYMIYKEKNDDGTVTFSFRIRNDSKFLDIINELKDSCDCKLTYGGHDKSGGLTFNFNDIDVIIENLNIICNK